MVTPVTVIVFPTIIPAIGMIYLGVNGNTFNITSKHNVKDVPDKMDAPATYELYGT